MLKKIHLESYQSPIFSQDLKQFVIIEPINVHGEGVFPHLVRRTIATNQQQVPLDLTPGKISVERIVSWDMNTDTM